MSGELDRRGTSMDVLRALDALGEAVALLDHEGRFVFVSEAASRLLGRDDLLSRRCVDAGEEFAEIDRARRVAAADGTVARAVVARVGASRVAVSLTKSAEGVLATWRDEAPPLRGDGALDDRVLATVTHDLRNPLNAILMAARLLLKDAPTTSTQARLGARIQTSGTRMQRMIEHLLDYARTRQGGTLSIERRAVDLGDLTRRVVDETQLAFAGREVRVDANGALFGSWDPDRLCEVLSNLIGNALQHGAHGTAVRVTVRGIDDAVRIEVHNDGAPIPPDLLPGVFDPFRGTKSSRPGSLGLGLYIAKEIVVAHGGSIAVTSSEADGTTFAVRLPRVDAVPASQRDASGM